MSILKYYAGTIAEIQGVDDACMACGWPDDQDIMDLLPLRDIHGTEYPGLHIYEAEFSPYYDEPGGSGFVTVQCQRCYSFFRVDVSS